MTTTQETQPFYKISNPTTQQIFDSIIAREYTPLESIKPKAKQINVLLMDYWNTSEVLVTFDNVTNTGGVPIFFASNTSLYEVASEINEDWYNMVDEDQSHETELLGSYCRTFKQVFDIN